MNGLLLIDKPRGITSHDVIYRLRRLFRDAGVLPVPKVGHAGTLDPLATGLLLVGVGKGTKNLQSLVGLDKTYEAELTLGATSDTFDAEGTIIPFPLEEGEHKGEPTAPTNDEIQTVINKFTGSFDQLAPLFSAKKIKGQKLYDLARKGTATEEMRPSKLITIHELEITDYNYPILKLTVRCSSGTYIRSLADDIGRALGTGAYLTALRRTHISTYDVKDAISLTKPTIEDLNRQILPFEAKT
ncbi:MAG: tRNA pseudouridine(55) synthase TruB [bacterium]|nr:tRNA pseudouridine(55) synthase TruB [bacterium]